MRNIVLTSASAVILWTALAHFSYAADNRYFIAQDLQSKTCTVTTFAPDGLVLRLVDRKVFESQELALHRMVSLKTCAHTAIGYAPPHSRRRL